MPDEWPWPETRLARRTRIANLYRDCLYAHNPDACNELDHILDTYGQHWITGNKPPINPDEPLTATEIAEWLDFGRVSAVTNRIAYHNIKPVGLRNGRKTYWLSDFVIDLRKHTRLNDSEPTPQDVAMQ